VALPLAGGPSDADRPPAGQGTTTSDSAADAALELRDKALARLDEGDPAAALALARSGLVALSAGGITGLDEVALLIAMAEIEETLGQFSAAEKTARAAVDLLGGYGPAEDSPAEDSPAEDSPAEDSPAEDSPAEDSPADHETHEDGHDDWLLLWCQANERLAGLERTAGDYAAASARLRTVLDRAAEALGEVSPPVISAANALGVVGKSCGDLDAAESAYRRALAALEAMPEQDPLTRAVLLHNLGGLAHSRGDADAGIPLAEQGLALRTGKLGADHPDVARDLNALGALYQLAGRYRDADQAYRAALAAFERSYGSDHFEVAMTCANLAVLRSDQGDFAQAEAEGRRALRILETVLGPADAEVGLTLLNLAAAVAGLGRDAEATELATRAAEILRAQLPADHPHVLAASEALGRWSRPA
jgi:tetratricopeptide (TPR) repeat protein